MPSLPELLLPEPLGERQDLISCVSWGLLENQSIELHITRRVL